jgi:hypothetical protein
MHSLSDAFYLPNIISILYPSPAPPKTPPQCRYNPYSYTVKTTPRQRPQSQEAPPSPPPLPLHLQPQIPHQYIHETLYLRPSNRELARLVSIPPQLPRVDFADLRLHRAAIG